MELTLKEKEILVNLLDSAKTFEELQSKTFFGFNETRETIKELIKKNHIKKEKSFPTKYSLKKELIKNVREIKRKIDWTELVSDACFVCKY
ncbi:MAG: hypothetical protein ABH986_00090 [archaeon]